MIMFEQTLSKICVYRLYALQTISYNFFIMWYCLQYLKITLKFVLIIFFIKRIMLKLY